ncbi:hypothetical protein BKA70DRAFT_1244692, partial [Coprinopsis sp. MPI-PUGE-AT-0042]
PNLRTGRQVRLKAEEEGGPARDGCFLEPANIPLCGITNLATNTDIDSPTKNLQKLFRRIKFKAKPSVGSGDALSDFFNTIDGPSEAKDDALSDFSNTTDGPSEAKNDALSDFFKTADGPIEAKYQTVESGTRSSKQIGKRKRKVELANARSKRT